MDTMATEKQNVIKTNKMTAIKLTISDIFWSSMFI